MKDKNIDNDISEEEFNKVLKPFIDNYDEYVESYVKPKVIAYYITNAYYRNSPYRDTFL